MSKEINWSLFAHLAQDYFVFSRIALGCGSGQTAATLWHQMTELYVKAHILYSVFNANYVDFESYRSANLRVFHNTIFLMEQHKEAVPVFKMLLDNLEFKEVIANLSDNYIPARFGQVHTDIKVSTDLVLLDKIFQLLNNSMFSLTGVHSLRYLKIPSSHLEFFLKSSILDFSGPSCSNFGEVVANIIIKES